MRPPTQAASFLRAACIGSGWPAVKVTRMTEPDIGGPPKIFHSTGPGVSQVSSLDMGAAVDLTCC